MALPLAAPLGAPAVAVYRASPQCATTRIAGGRPQLALTARLGGAMPAKPFSFSLPVGDSADLKLTLLDSSGAPFDPAGTDLAFMLRASPSAALPALVKASGTAPAQIEFMGGDPANVVTVHIAKGDLIFGSYLAALSATDTLTAVQTTWTGIVSVTSHA